ncbi:hypothetical protein RR46_10066 [Papilio xuthus]|uniref:PAS domain-containing protein n=1 Tax=Papilio xuthus TaxID=66420 RepID=A0A194Q0C1_PAPXU|nr:hypothetical protein RR46_10066 [Papilio xuthus]
MASSIKHKRLRNTRALNGFLMMMTQNGKLLYISDNAAEYLGHSMKHPVNCDEFGGRRV